MMIFSSIFPSHTEACRLLLFLFLFHVFSLHFLPASSYLYGIPLPFKRDYAGPYGIAYSAYREGGGGDTLVCKYSIVIFKRHAP